MVILQKVKSLFLFTEGLISSKGLLSEVNCNFTEAYISSKIFFTSKLTLQKIGAAVV